MPGEMTPNTPPESSGLRASDSGASPDMPGLRIQRTLASELVDPAKEIAQLFKKIRAQSERIESEFGDNPVAQSKMCMDSYRLQARVLRDMGDMEQREMDQALELQKMADKRSEGEANREQRARVAYFKQYEKKRLPDGREVAVAMEMPMGEGEIQSL